MYTFTRTTNTLTNFTVRYKKSYFEVSFYWRKIVVDGSIDEKDTCIHYNNIPFYNFVEYCFIVFNIYIHCSCSSLWSKFHNQSYLQGNKFGLRIMKIYFLPDLNYILISFKIAFYSVLFYKISLANIIYLIQRMNIFSPNVKELLKVKNDC